MYAKHENYIKHEIMTAYNIFLGLLLIAGFYPYSKIISVVFVNDIVLQYNITAIVKSMK